MTSTERYSALKTELDELVSLAEASARAIDEITSRLQVREAMSDVTGYIGLAALAGSAVALVLMNASWLVGVSLAIVGLGMMILALKQSRDSRKLRRDLRVERDIHDRLISLIDDQKGRVIGEMSPVAVATLEIRLRRLNRSE